MRKRNAERTISKRRCEVKVLFVDDEVDFLEVMVKRLKKRDLDVTSLSDGNKVIELIEKNNFDVVVLDVRMPGCKNGIEILKDIKKCRPLVEVVMLTGHALLDVAKEGIENGAFDYMVKPADIDELFYILNDAYKKKTIQESKIKNIEHLLQNK
ncbi:MAG: response regulator [Desulfobacteraceae bacterium]|nr:MAG: response regulator [Desulfobacteraceae bacterium]